MLLAPKLCQASFYRPYNYLRTHKNRYLSIVSGEPDVKLSLLLEYSRVIPEARLHKKALENAGRHFNFFFLYHL